MFYNCTNLGELFLPVFNTKMCQKYSEAFNGCYNLILKINGAFFNLRRYCPNYVKIIDITD